MKFEDGLSISISKDKAAFSQKFTTGNGSFKKETMAESETKLTSF
jgi:hypothetical protein